VTLRLRPITKEDAHFFASWRYPEPYSLYDSSPDDVHHYLDPANAYSTVVDDDGQIVGLCCFGIDARVPGGTYDDEPIDFGTGMRPDLTGQGNGRSFLNAVLAEAAQRYPGRPLRTTVAAFNERAQHLVRTIGFQEIELFRNPAGREFTVFLRPAC
jgi:RimJ/RimL family protein N-acetyltransferase